jgi:hypothetical protein
MGSLTNETAAEAMARKDEEIARLQRLLLGACRAIVERLGCDTSMGPELREWWLATSEAGDMRARRVISSLTDEDVDALRKYLDKHGELPK